mmetsp:Transcript_34693/g.82714  ORF Transcript_34693/g.82714 Transcript_34693/m.82714 type:complete len:247 (-) Transcript_34693:462-1202(-)
MSRSMACDRNSVMSCPTPTTPTTCPEASRSGVALSSTSTVAPSADFIGSSYAVVPSPRSAWSSTACTAAHDSAATNSVSCRPSTPRSSSYPSIAAALALHTVTALAAFTWKMGALAAVMSAVSSASEAARPISASTSKTAPYHTVYMLGSRCGIAPHLTHFHPAPPGPSPEAPWEQLWGVEPPSSVAAALELELLGGMLATRPVHFHSVRSRQLLATLSAKEGRSAEWILLMSSKGSAMMAWAVTP